MKSYLSKFLAGCIGVSVGFALGYFAFVDSKTGTNPPVVTATSDGSLYLGGSKTDLSQLTVSLKKQTSFGQTITILADTHLDSKKFEAILNACKAGGTTKLSMRVLALD